MGGLQTPSGLDEQRMSLPARIGRYETERDGLRASRAQLSAGIEPGRFSWPRSEVVDIDDVVDGANLRTGREPPEVVRDGFRVGDEHRTRPDPRDQREEPLGRPARTHEVVQVDH